MYCPNCGTPRRPATASPLGPRNLGSIFKDTFRIYWAGFLGIVIIVALVQVPLALLGIWFESTIDNDVVDLVENFDPEDPSVDIPLVLEALRPVVTLILAAWLTSILMTGANPRQLPQPGFGFGQGHFRQEREVQGAVKLQDTVQNLFDARSLYFR